MKTLHSLVIGIDRYPIPAHQLNGCVNDATAFKNYLASYAKANGVQYREKFLFNEDAKRQSIIDEFNFLKKAVSGDTCVLYYSGHGSQMKAAPEFWDEQDGLSETLVCWDSRLQNGRDLIDKELATLIWSVTNEKNIHFLAVMDCCHSGSNTREIEVKARMAEPSSFVPKDVSGYFGKEFWTNFQPPSSRHIHLAAAKDSETAKELKIQGIPRGAFTYTLLDTLTKTGDCISYEELISRVGQTVKNMVQQQTPQCDAYKVPKDVGLTFLGAALKKGEFLVSHDNTEGWIVNVGGVQGIPTSGAIFLLENGREISIIETRSNFSKVAGMDANVVTEQFKATLKSIDERSVKLPRLKVAFSSDSDKKGVEILKKRFRQMSYTSLQLVDNESDTDYIIWAWDGAYRLTKRNDAVPLFKRIEGYSEENADVFLNNIETVANWKAKLNLDNPLTKIVDNEFEIALFDVENKRLKSPYILRQKDSKTDFVLQVGVKNTGKRTYWVSGLYFSADFGITNQFLPKKEINPGETAWVEFENNREIPFSVQKEYLTWGVNEIHESFQFFISTDPINTNIHNQNALELDEKKEGFRGIGHAAKPEIPMTDWRVISVPITMICPLEKQNLAAGKSVEMFDFQVETPEGFTAQATLSTTSQATREVGNTPVLRGGASMSPAALTEGMGNSPAMNVLELRDVTGKVSIDKPLKVKVKNINKNETIMPFGFDKESGLFVPLGFSDEAGVVNIEHLTPPEVGELTRGLLDSLGSSIKIYFQKIIAPLTGDYEYPMLRMAIFDDNSENFEYENDVEKIKKAVAEASSIVLFIHGLIGSTSDMPKAIRRANGTVENADFEKKYQVILTFDYENLNTRIEDTAIALEIKLQKLGITEGVGKQFDIVAHSMGCLVSRYLVEKLTGNKFVSRLLLFGGPSHGSELSDVQAMLSNVMTMAVNGISFFQPYLWSLSFLGKYLSKLTVTISELNPKSDFITDLNKAENTNIPYYIIAGNTQLIEQNRPKDYVFYQKVMNTLKNRGTYAAADWIFSDANDMAVRVVSARSVGQQKNVHFEEIASDHFSFFNAESVGVKALVEVVLAK